MMKQILLEMKKMDHSITTLMKSGIHFSFGISMIAILILLTYDFLYSIPSV